MLRLQNLSYKYNSNSPLVLDDFSCEFESGRLYAIMGGSGSGKTTLISIIARLDKPTSGTIFYNGKDVAKINPDKYRSKMVSVIFQSYNLLYNHTAQDNIAAILNICGYKGDYKKRATELLDDVALPKEKHSSLTQNLSGGEQQRVAIARALASDAGVVLADEPTGNLDKTNEHNVLSIFRKLADKYNKCVIIVTHSDSVAEFADSVIKI